MSYSLLVLAIKNDELTTKNHISPLWGWWRPAWSCQALGHLPLSVTSTNLMIQLITLMIWQLWLFDNFDDLITLMIWYFLVIWQLRWFDNFDGLKTFMFDNFDNFDNLDEFWQLWWFDNFDDFKTVMIW